MICGPVGAGKTTYAIKLAKELGAVRFSIDDWISELFLPDNPDPFSYEWALARAMRCERRILAVSRDILDHGTDVIWDMGCMERSQRDRIINALGDAPHLLRMYSVDAPAAVRRARVRQRNIERPTGFVIDVTDEIFDFMESRSAPVSSDEASDVIHIDTSSDGKI